MTWWKINLIYYYFNKWITDMMWPKTIVWSLNGSAKVSRQKVDVCLQEGLSLKCQTEVEHCKFEVPPPPFSRYFSPLCPSVPAKRIRNCEGWIGGGRKLPPDPTGKQFLWQEERGGDYGYRWHMMPSSFVLIPEHHHQQTRKVNSGFVLTSPRTILHIWSIVRAGAGGFFYRRSLRLPMWYVTFSKSRVKCESTKLCWCIKSTCSKFWKRCYIRRERERERSMACFSLSPPTPLAHQIFNSSSGSIGAEGSEAIGDIAKVGPAKSQPLCPDVGF